MAVARKALDQKPDAKAEANFREAARANLEQLLKTDPQRVRITSAGLELR